MKFQQLKRLIAVILIPLVSFCPFPEKNHITIWMIGDSTMCLYGTDRAPVTGWGMPFAGYFDTTVTIQNKAREGRSTRTFISEGRWNALRDSLQPGDYVFIQFGHNDEAKEEKYRDRYTPVADYKANLVFFITTAREKKAIPLLITPVTRRRFNQEGIIEETHREYSAAVLEVAERYEVHVIDLDRKSRDLLQQYGPEQSKLLFMQLDPGEHPNYPEGQKDNTHFNEYGARKIAGLVYSTILESDLDLKDRVIKKITRKK